MNQQILCLVFLLVTFSPLSGGVTFRWFKQVAAKTNTTLVFDAYYAKCLVDAPEYLPDCNSIAYGVGLGPRAAKDFARFHAVALGEPHCDRYLGQCLIRQYCRN